MRVSKLMSAAAIMSAVVLLLPGPASAQTVADLQAQITVLLAQIQQLQAQLNNLQVAPPAFCHTFNTNLGIWSSGVEVTALQTALSKEFPGQAVSASSNFDETLASLVSAFQEKYRSEVLTPAGLTAGTGYVGARTRTKLNQLYGCGVTVTPPTTASSLSIADVSGVNSTYSPNQQINLTIKGARMPGGTPVSSVEGFNVQVHIYDSARAKTYSGVNGVYDSSSGSWSVSMIAPADTSLRYDMEVILYCGNARCGAAVGRGSEYQVKTFSFVLSGGISQTQQPTLLINNVQSGSWSVGNSWFLNLSNATLNQPVYVCGWQSQTANPSNVDSITTCTPAGNLSFSDNTSGYGTWSASGSFTSNGVGYWREWVVVGDGTMVPTIVQNGLGGQKVNGGTLSNAVTFNVVSTTTPPPSSGNLLTLSPSSLTIPTGFANGVVVTAPNSTSPVAVSVERGTLPSTVTVSQSITAINNATGLTAVAVGVTVGSGTPAGAYSFTIVGTQNGQAQRQPITLTVTGTTPPSSGSFSATPYSLNFSAQQGGTVSPPLSIIMLTNYSLVNGTIGKNYTSGSSGTTDWLVWTLNSNWGVTVAPNVANLSPGIYTANIVITSNSQTVTVPVTLTVVAAGTTPPPSSDTLSVSPTSLTFSVESMGASQTKQLTLSKDCSSPSCTVVKDYPGNTLPAGIEWLTSGLPNNSTPRVVTVSVDPSMLPPGTYTGQIMVSIRVSAYYQTVIVPVTITVAPASTTALVVSPLRSLTFSAQQGGTVSPSTIPIMLTNYSIGRIGANGTISRVYTSGFSGTTEWLVGFQGNPNPFNLYWTYVVPNNANLSPGIYTANIVITSNSQTVTLPVTLTVVAAGATPPPSSGTQPALLTMSGVPKIGDSWYFYNGGSWWLTLWPGAPANQPVYICGNKINEKATCTPAASLGYTANTDEIGSWSAHGRFATTTADVGDWTEWVFVGGTITTDSSGAQTVVGGIESNTIKFAVVKYIYPYTQ